MISEIFDFCPILVNLEQLFMVFFIVWRIIIIREMDFLVWVSQKLIFVFYSSSASR
jgi:hypothetical protein